VSRCRLLQRQLLALGFWVEIAMVLRLAQLL